MKRLNENSIKLKQMMRKVEDMINEDVMDYVFTKTMGLDSDNATVTAAKDLARAGVSANYSKNTSTIKSINIKKIHGDDVEIDHFNLEGTLFKETWSGKVDVTVDVIKNKRGLVISGSWAKLAKIDDSLFVGMIPTTKDKFYSDVTNDVSLYVWTKKVGKEAMEEIGEFKMDLQFKKELFT